MKLQHELNDELTDQLNYKLTYERIDTNGTMLNVASAGAGPAVVLLHGFPDTHKVWRKQVLAFTGAGMRVIMPDLRGYGASTMPDGVKSYRVGLLSKDVIGLLDAMKLERVCLVGHDWGALVGWHVCMAAPARIERFAALSVGHPNAYANAGLAQKMKAWYAALFQLPGVAEALVGAGNLMALKRHAADAEQLADWRKNFGDKARLTAALNYYRANRHLALAREYPPITLPVLGIWSEGDPALTERQMKNSSAYVTGPFRYERLTGDVGHWMQLSDPQRVNQLLIDFFNAGKAGTSGGSPG